MLWCIPGVPLEFLTEEAAEKYRWHEMLRAAPEPLRGECGWCQKRDVVLHRLTGDADHAYPKLHAVCETCLPDVQARSRPPLGSFFKGSLD